MKRYCLVFKKSGIESKWQRSSAMTKEEAFTSKERMIKMGYVNTMVFDYKQSVNIGLPDND
jgi:hypothetical protein